MQNVFVLTCCSFGSDDFFFWIWFCSKVTHGHREIRIQFYYQHPVRSQTALLTTTAKQSRVFLVVVVARRALSGAGKQGTAT